MQDFDEKLWILKFVEKEEGSKCINKTGIEKL